MIIEYHRIKKFLIVGGSAAIVNLAAMSLLVEILGFKTYLLKNIANMTSIEISIFYNFVFQRLWTWNDTPKKDGKNLMGQFFLFNSAALAGILIRIALFALLDLTGLYYLFNVAFGIGVAASIDFILYDKIVFRRGALYEKKSL